MDSANASRLKILLFLLVVGLLGLIFAIDFQRRQAEEQLGRLSVRLDQMQGHNEENQVQARKIISQVKKLYLIEGSVEPTVAKIVNVEALRARNAFYAKADNDDYLLVTSDSAILYDPDRNIILGVAPIQIQSAQPASVQKE